MDPAQGEFVCKSHKYTSSVLDTGAQEKNLKPQESLWVIRTHLETEVQEVQVTHPVTHLLPQSLIHLLTHLFTHPAIHSLIPLSKTSFSIFSLPTCPESNSEFWTAVLWVSAVCELFC